jgi:hypothetical protein
LAPNFWSILVRKPLSSSSGKADTAESDNKNHSMIFVFQKDNIGIETNSVFIADRPALPSTGSRMTRQNA